MSTKEKWVHRFAVDDNAKHKNGFTIYKITSYLYPINSPESITIVSVWKRYSDVERLHKSMRSLHAGLYLPGTFPTLIKRSFFKRFDQEVIEERAKNIKTFLEFIALHQLLCTSTDFVKFLECGYPEPPDKQSSSVINSIRTSLHLPIEESTPLEYQSSEDEGNSPRNDTSHKSPQTKTMDDTKLDQDFSGLKLNINDIKIETKHENLSLNLADSIESLNSLESLNSDIFDEISKISLEKHKSLIKNKSVLPDLINFDEPSTSKFDDYHTMSKTGNTDSDSTSLNSISMHSEPKRSVSRISLSSKRSLNMSENYKVRMDDDYVFEAAQLLNLAAKYESMKDIRKAFDYYNCAIEKMLIGVKSDTDPERRALIKKKTGVYLSHAEMLYNNHLCNNEDINLLSNLPDRSAYNQLPIRMLQGEYNDLLHYKVIGIVGDTLMVVLHSTRNKCYVMKVIKKVPFNLTDFDGNIPRSLTTRHPILPTNVPYMVNLNSFVETENLVFLILEYAPGEKLRDYINKYVQSLPNTPARELNLENVFINPIPEVESSNYSTKDEVDNAIRIENDEIRKRNDEIGNRNDEIGNRNDEIGNRNDQIGNRNDEIGNRNDEIGNKTDEIGNRNDEIGNKTDETKKTETTEVDISVNELVLNSQRLLSNIDKTLSAVRQKDVIIDRIQIEVVDKNSNSDVLNKNEQKSPGNRNESPSHLRLTPRCRSVLPPSAICKWAAEILVALESLHNCGVICRDLNPSNILLGNNGQVLLTYFVGYDSMEMALSLIQKRTVLGHSNLYIAPELYNIMSIDTVYDERVSDYWSYGAVLYQLLCGVPLSHYHKSVFNSHTILVIPEHIDVEANSILTQLLTFDPSERLGAGKQGVTEIKQHPYFKHIDWRHVYDSWKTDSEGVDT